MVNQSIVNYLSEGKRRGFAVNLLKQKLLEGGFNHAEVNEAIAIVESKIIPPQISNSRYGEPVNFKVSSGIKWMKIAGIIGFVFATLTLLSIISILFPHWRRL
mgnify:CR=1 FL=1